jgi:hypothetical protein
MAQNSKNWTPIQPWDVKNFLRPDRGRGEIPLRRFAFFRVSCRPHGLLGWKALGLSVSTPLLGRADEVIE